jgi:alanyl-tRNA synthetase
MKITEIRQKFMDFYATKSHKVEKSAAMVVKNDPTLMCTNAGMNQFKDYFLGYNEPKDSRIANTQKCLRVSGKHNDLEEVGVDTYHHTMFEMLGNWSFGDYFKEEAIAWAWELLTEVYKIDKSKLYVTVFEGDKSDGTVMDQEAYDIWKKYIDEDRIILANKADNFWEMGETGPCGPCSEIHVDIRDDSEKAKVDGRSLVNMDDPQVIEIWNLVFMQFNRKKDKSLHKLAETHVDTGMGLERLAMVMQDVQSNYDTDLFQYLIQHISKISGIEYGKNEPKDIAMRVIADHIRAIAFSITDGQLPSNNGAGYVIRRILRRAVRYGYQTLDLKEPFFYTLVEKLGEVMGDAFPELIKQKDLIEKVVKEEELSFFRTLAQGIKKIDALISDAKANKIKELKGTDVFELYDTFGFPLDLTSLIASENNLKVDETGFQVELTKQKERGRAATKIESEDWVVLREDDVEEFVGYDLLEADVYITKYRKVIQKKKEFYQLVFNVTPFYAEGGGQVGDKGFIKNEIESVVIFYTKKENNLIVHSAKSLPIEPTKLFKASVGVEKRKLSEANHTATHLLHHALREVLGTHVEQKGSLVNADNLRFDFSHFSKVTDEELELIENKVNAAIKSNTPLNEERAVPISVAEEMGAMALFGEKYGDLVRVIKFDESVELCGGTHVKNTSNIGMFKFVSESSVAAGVRRVEAITSTTAEAYYKTRANQFNQISVMLKKPKNLVSSIEELMQKNNLLQKEIEKLQKDKVKSMKAGLLSQVENKDGINFLSTILDLDGGSIKDLCFQLKGELDDFVGVIGGKADSKATVTIIIAENIAKEKELHAGNLVREASKLIQGGGGGQPFFATAGGKNAGGLNDALELVAKKVFG